MSKTTNLQPWLDYFSMLQTCEKKGLLEVLPDIHEAYITQPALHAIGGGESAEQLLMAVPATARHIRAYAGWKSCQGFAYINRPFAVHVVRETYPHDLVYSLLLLRKRAWWKLWRLAEKLEVINYVKPEET